MKKTIDKKHAAVLPALIIIAIIAVFSVGFIVSAPTRAQAQTCVHEGENTTVGNDTVCSVCGASVWDGSSDMKVFSFATNTIEVNNAAQLKGLADMTANGFDLSPYTIKLNADIDLNGREWTKFNDFGGTFDGQGHTISNGKILAVDNEGTSFFGTVNKITFIKNLTFRNVTSQSATYTKLSIVLSDNTANGTTVENVNLYNCFVNAQKKSGDNAGGFFLSKSTGSVAIKNCGVYTSVFYGGMYNVSAFVDTISSTAYDSVIENCVSLDTFIIGTGSKCGAIVRDGGGTTKVINTYSDLWPNGKTMDGIRDKFSAEQQAAYDKAIADEGRTVYQYVLADNCEVQNSGAMLQKVALDEKDVVANIQKGEFVVEENAAEKITVEFGLPVDLTVSVDGTESSFSGKTYERTLTKEMHGVTINAKYGPYETEFDLVVGLGEAVAVADGTGAIVKNGDAFVSCEDFKTRVSAFSSGYKLKKTADNPIVTIKNDGSAITEEGTDMPYKEYALAYMQSAEVNYNGKSRTIEYGVWADALISAAYAYPMAWDETRNAYRSTNQGKDGSQSGLKIILAPGKKLAFSFSVSAEGSYGTWDYLTVDGTNVNSGGKINTKTEEEIFADASLWYDYELTNTTDGLKTVELYYKKDGSGKGGCDTAFVRNVLITDAETAPAANSARNAAENETSGDITVPENATKYADNVYYVHETEKKIVYDESKGYFITETDKAQNATITFYITNSDIFRFKYDDSTYYANQIDMCLDGVKQSLTGDKQSGITFIDTAIKFDTVGTHTIKFEFLYYGWYSFAIAEPSAHEYTKFNVKIEVGGNGEVVDLANFAYKPVVGSNSDYGLFDRIQLFGIAPADSASEYLGYRIKGADGEYGDLIKENGAIIEITADTDILVEFGERVIVPNEIGYTLIVNSETKEEKKLSHYEKITFDSVVPHAEAVLRVPVVSGAEVTVLDSTVGTEIATETDRNEHYYKLSDVFATRDITFIYRNGEKTTKLVLKIVFDADISKYLVTADSLPVEVINDDPTFPFVYRSDLTDTDRYAFASSITNKGVNKYASNIGLKVKGTGVILFDYYVSTEDTKDHSSYVRKNMGDRAIYAIGEKVTWDALAETYGFIPESKKNLYGYVGADLGSDDYSKSQGLLGWKRGAIAVSAAADKETTVYVAYVKDQNDKSGDCEPHEDTFAIANVMFVTGTYVLDYSTNSSSATVTATGESGESIVGGTSVAAGSRVAFTVSGQAADEKFIGWANGDGEVVSYEKTYSVSISRATSIRALFALPNEPFYVGGNTYSTLGQAIESLKSGDTYESGTIILYADATVENSVTVPQNVTLLLPYKIGPGADYGIGDRIYERVSWKRGIKPFVTLTVGGGVTLTVDGTLKVGAVQHTYEQTAQGMTSGDYALLINDGNVVIRGDADVRGRVTGSGTLTVNGGATMKQPFLVNNYSGGTNTQHLYNDGQFPFVQFATINVECKQVYEYGCKIIGTTALFFWGGITTQDVVLVEKYENKAISGEGSLIWMHEGSRLEITYDGQRTIDRTYGAGALGFTVHLGDSGVTTVDVYGTITAGEFYLQGYGSKTMVLAVPYTYDFNVKDGGKIVVSQKYKIMPGAVVTVEQGGEILVEESGALYVYDGLIQAMRDNKQYPQAATLAKYGFDKSGMLVVDGILTIKGAFAGTVQTLGNGEIVVGKDATVGTQTIIDGSEGGYSGNNSSDKTVFDMNGRIYGLNGYIALEQGKTYKAFSTDTFVLEKFTVTSASRVSSLTETLNQELSGRFLPLDGDGNFVGEVIFAVNESLNGKVIVIAGVNCFVENGTVTATITIPQNKIITYYTSEFEKSTASHELTVKCGTNVLDKAVLSIALDGNNDYFRVLAANGGVKKDFALNAIVSYADGTTENIVLGCPEVSDKVNENQTLSNSNYVTTFTKTLYVVPKEAEEYIAAAGALETSANVPETAAALFVKYNALTDSTVEEYRNYVVNYLKNHIAYASEIVKSVALKSGEKVVYGDETAKAVITYVNGDTAEASVGVKDYGIKENLIKGTLVYKGTYGSASYEITAETVVDKKKVTVTIDDKTSEYGAAEKVLTASASGLVAGDTYESLKITLVKENGKNAGEYAITGTSGSEFYDVTFENGVYAITKFAVVVTTGKIHDVMVGFTDKIAISDETDRVTPDEGFVNILTHEVYSGETLVAVIAANGEVTVLGGGSLTVGEYTVVAVSADENYEITETVSATLSVVEENKYYTVDFGVGESKVYDGLSLNVVPTVIVSETAEEIAAFVTKITLNGKDAEIKNAGTYLITVTVKEDNKTEVVYSRAYTVTPKSITVRIDDKQSVYGEETVTLTASASGLVEGDTYDGLSVELTKESGKTVGEYEITGTANNDNYAVTFKKGTYTITARKITVKMEDKQSVYGEEIKTLTYSVKNGTLAAGELLNFVTASKEDGTEVGTYTITGAANNDNYDVTFENGTYTITKKSITVTIEDKQSVYGEEFVVLTASANGYAYEDDYATLGVTLTKEDGLEVGTYEISGRAESRNYEVTFTNVAGNSDKAKYTITKKAIKVIVEDKQSVYGEEIVKAEGKLSEETPLAYDDKFDFVTVTRKNGDKVTVGRYELTATNENGNYEVTFEYTDKANERSYYEITARPIKIKAADISAAFDKTYEEVRALLGYEVTEGTVLEGDEITVEYEIKINGITVNETNYAGTVSGGTHEVAISGENENYAITAEKGTFTVTAPKVTVDGMKTAFVYDDGKEIVAFNWKENVKGYLPSATDKSFGAVITDKDGKEIEKITEAGEYTVKIEIIHTLAYEFAEGTVTEYKVTVEKKDISDAMEITGIPESKWFAKAKGIFVNYRFEGEYAEKEIEVKEEFTINGKKTEEIYEEGEYTVKFTIEDVNYKGEVKESFSVYENVYSKIGEIKTELSKFAEAKTTKEKLDRVKKMKEIVKSFGEEDKKQIAADEEYKKTMGEYEKAYEETIKEIKEDALVAEKAAGNALAEAIAALSVLAVGLWFGLKNR